MLKKAVFLGLILIVAGTVFAGGGSQPAGGTAASSGGAAAAAPVTVRWLMQVGSEAEAGQWREIAADVSKHFPGITVDMATTDWNGYWAKLPTEIAGGNPPDVLYMQVLRAGSFVESSFEPLDSYIAADSSLNIGDFYKGVLDGLGANGKIYCLPYDFGPYVMFYNIDLFTKHNVPLPVNASFDFAAYQRACQALSNGGDFGAAIAANIDRSLTFIMGEGVTFFNAAGKFVVNDPKIVAVIQRQAEFIRSGLAPRQTDTGNFNWDREQFYSGRVGMMPDGPWNITNIKTYAKFKVGATLVPTGSVRRGSPVNGSGFGVAKDSKHKQEAYKAVTSITSADSLTKLAQWGRALPARASVRDVYYQQHTDVPGLREAVEASLQPDVGIPYITPKSWQEVYNTINQNIEPVFLGNMDAKTGLDNAQKIIDGILGQ